MVPSGWQHTRRQFFSIKNPISAQKSDFRPVYKSNLLRLVVERLSLNNHRMAQTTRRKMLHFYLLEIKYPSES